MSQSKSVLKSYFETGDKPTQAQFSQLIETMVDYSQAGYPVFDEEVTYSVGDVVTYMGEFYRFIREHTGVWLDRHVTPTTLKSEFKDSQVFLTEEEYEAIEVKDSSKLYFVYEES